MILAYIMQRMPLLPKFGTFSFFDRGSFESRDVMASAVTEWQSMRLVTKLISDTMVALLGNCSHLITNAF